MKPAPWLLFGLLLTAVVCLPALPQLQAQYRGGPICPYAVTVTHMQVQQQQTMYYQQMQQQQMMQQRLQMQYQQQQMMLQQRQQQLVTQQQQVKQQQKQLQMHVNKVQQNVNHLNVTNHQVTWNWNNMRVPVGGGHVGMLVPRVNTGVGQVHMTVAQLHTGVKRLNTAVQTVSTRVNRLDTSVARVNTSVAQVNTNVARVNTNVQRVNTLVARLDTGSKTICTNKDITIVTINYNCMACHKQMNAVPQQPGLQNPLVRQNVPQMPVARKPVPQLPNLVAKQPQPQPNLMAKPPQLPMPVVNPRVPQLPLPVLRYVQQVPAPLFQPIIQQLPVPVNQPQLVQMWMPQPILNMPVQLVPYARPGLFVTRSSDLPTMTSTWRKPTTEPSTLKAVAPQSQESLKTQETLRMQVVLSKELLEQPPDLLMPVTAPSQQGSNSRLNLGELVTTEGETPPPARTVSPWLNDDERDLPPLPALPRSIWLPPNPATEVIENFDRAPIFAGSGPPPLENNTTPSGNLVRSSLTQPLDAPPPLKLPSSIRIAS